MYSHLICSGFLVRRKENGRFCNWTCTIHIYTMVIFSCVVMYMPDLLLLGWLEVLLYIIITQISFTLSTSVCVFVKEILHYTTHTHTHTHIHTSTETWNKITIHTHVFWYMTVLIIDLIYKYLCMVLLKGVQYCHNLDISSIYPGIPRIVLGSPIKLVGETSPCILEYLVSWDTWDDPR